MKFPLLRSHVWPALILDHRLEVDWLDSLLVRLWFGGRLARMLVQDALLVVVKLLAEFDFK